MRMNLFQILFLSGLLILMFRQYLELKSKPILKVVYGMRWTFLVICAFVIIAYPPLSQRIATIFGISRGADFVVYVSLLWLLYKLYYLSKQVTELNEKIEKLSRKIALKNQE